MNNNSDKNIFTAFLLNISFAIIEFFGGIFTSSIAIISDSFHDLIDAISIGISYFFEKKSKLKPDDKFTYGYIRYSLLGAFFTSFILVMGSIFVIIVSFLRIMKPVDVNYEGMIYISILGILFNFIAAYKTRKGESLNQKAVNLHMLEDVFGWIVVFIGSILIKFTNINYIDSIMSIFISIFIFIHAFKHLKSVIDLFLEKVPKNISLDKIIRELKNIDGVEDVHHIHIWSMDGINNCATLHVVSNNYKIKNDVRDVFFKNNISHVTVEIEEVNEMCDERDCF